MTRSVVKTLLFVIFITQNLLPGVYSGKSISQAKALLRYRSHLLQRFISLKHERHRTTQFTYTTLNTEVEVTSNNLPTVPDSPGKILDMIKGTSPCRVSIQVNIIKFRKSRPRTVCLFREAQDESIFENNMKIQLMEETLLPADLAFQAAPVTGFVVNEISSAVKGFLVDKYFYGSIKLFDKFRAYHLHFYIEPIENLVLYSAKYLDKTVKRPPGDNAILFEYISHEDYYEKVKPPRTATPATPKPTEKPKTKPPKTKPPKTKTSAKVTKVTRSTTTTESAEITSSELPFASTSVAPPLSPSLLQSYAMKGDGDLEYDMDDPVMMLMVNALKRFGLPIYHSTEAQPLVGSTGYHSTEAVAREESDSSTPDLENPLHHSTEAVPNDGTIDPLYSTTVTVPAVDSEEQSSFKATVFQSTEAVDHSITAEPDHHYSTTVTVSKKSGANGRKKRSIPKETRMKRSADKQPKAIGVTPAPPKSTIVKMTDERLIFQDDDIAKTIQFKTGLSSADIFDLRLDQSLICSVCIWMQPHFAEIFGFNGGTIYGIAEIVEIMKLANWYFRALDFNSDGLADNIGLKIRTIVVTDDFKVQPTKEQIVKAKSSPFYPLMGSRRRKRSISPSGSLALSGSRDTFDIDSYDIDPGQMLEVHDLQYLNEIEGQGEGIRLGVPKPLEQEQESHFSRMIFSMPGKQAYANISSAIQKDQRFGGCCAVLGFLYHNLAPSMSVSTLRGACTSSNLALIPGSLHMHKVGKFDLLRSVMHSLGHLFGGHHDRTINSNCKDNHFSNFINPFLLDPIPQMNVGLRPNSMKMSPCAKIDIALFLSSPNQGCLRVDRSAFCGNGWLDEGETCDCGSPWQCHLDNDQCCGERDSMLGCKRVDSADTATIKSKKCPRPLLW